MVLSCSHTVSLLHECCSIVRGGCLEVKYFISKSLCDFSLIPNFLNPSLFCNTRRICLQKKEMGLSPHTRSLSQSILCRLFFPLRVPSAALLQPSRSLHRTTGRLHTIVPPYPADKSKQRQLIEKSDGYGNAAKMIAGVHLVTLIASSTILAPSASSPFDATFRVVIAPISGM